MRVVGTILGVAVAAFGVAACGGGDDSASTDDPAAVAQAEKQVNGQVEGALAAERERYPKDAQVYPAGSAVCAPISDAQLDCVQRIEDRTNPWTGKTTWRATVAESGTVRVVEHGGRTLKQHLDDRSAALGSGIAEGLYDGYEDRTNP